jgi:hypothetical protein
MANYTKVKRIWFTPEQIARLEELAQSPAYRYNGQPSENMVIRDAFDRFLSEMSKNIDKQVEQSTPSNAA